MKTARARRLAAARESSHKKEAHKALGTDEQMRLVVEEINLRRVRGWAFVDPDSAQKVQVVGRIGSEELFSVTSDDYRKDLHDAKVGDGFFGFEVSWSGGVWGRIQNNWRDFELVGRTDGKTEEVDAEYVHEAATILTSLTSDRMILAETFLGDSFFLDNISETEMFELSLDKRVGRHGVERTYRCRKTCCFGDYLWWDETDLSVRSATRLFADLGPRERVLIQADKLMLVFDMSSEGPPASHYSDWHVLLHDEMNTQKIRASSCIIVNQNRYYEFDYRAWCKRHGYGDRMHVFAYDYYIARLASLLDGEALGQRTAAPTDASDWRHFLCLNFTPRPERVAFVSWLFGKEYDTRGLLSFAGFQNIKADGREFAIPDWLPDRKTAIEGMERLRSIGSLHLDLAADTGSIIPEFSMGPPDAIARSFFTIVTESDFSPGDVLRITEKSIKPLAYGHPCLIVGNPGSLRILKELGFRTFSPFIDETYDEIDERSLRMAAVQKEVDRLCAMTSDQLQSLRRDLEPAVAFNYIHARRGLAAAYRERFRPDLIRQIIQTKPLLRYGDVFPNITSD